MKRVGLKRLILICLTLVMLCAATSILFACIPIPPIPGEKIKVVDENNNELFTYIKGESVNQVLSLNTGNINVEYYYAIDRDGVPMIYTDENGKFNCDLVTDYSLENGNTLKLYKKTYTSCYIMESDSYVKLYHGETPYIPPVSKSGYTFKGYEITVMDRVFVSDANGYFTTPWNVNVKNASADTIFEAKSYNLIFDDGVNPVTFTKKIDEYMPSADLIRSKEGYSFKGWFTQKEGGNKVVDELGTYEGSAIRLNANDYQIGLTTTDVRLYAQWEPKSYSVTYFAEHLNGEVFYNTTVYYGEVIQSKYTGNKPIKQGYIFAGWYHENTLIDNNTTMPFLANEVEYKIVAHWTPRTDNEVRYDLNGGLRLDENIELVQNNITTDEPFQLLELNGKIAKRGYELVGWTRTVGKDVKKYDDGKKDVTINTSITLVAEWKIVTYNVNYRVEVVGYPSSKLKYNFSPFESKYDYDSLLTYSALDVFGYEFVGWKALSDIDGTVDISYVGTKYSVQPNTVGNLDMVATFKPITYSLSITANGGTMNLNVLPSKNFNFESQYVNLDTYLFAVPDNLYTKNGYDFVGWTKNGEGTPSKNYAIDLKKEYNASTKSYSLYAHWTPHTYTLSYAANGGELPANLPTTLAYKENSKLAPIADATKFDYNFLGWYYDQALTERVENNQIVTDKNCDLTLYASFEAIEHTIEYKTNGGSFIPEVTTFTIESDNHFFINGVAQKTAYEFVDWFYDEQLTVATNGVIDTTCGKDLTLFAKWKPVQYTITYSTEGRELLGDVVETYNVEDGENGLLPITSYIEYTGYYFVGWYLDESLEQPLGDYLNVLNARNITLYPRVESYVFSIYYNADGGVVVDGVNKYTVTDGVNGYLPLTSNVLRKGYSFGGWYRDQQLTIPTNGLLLVSIAADVDLYAKWDIIDYPINYQANGGVINSVSVEQYNVQSGNQGLLQIDTSIQKNGYDFAGWCYDQQLTMPINGNIDVNIAAPITLYAKWNLLTYNIEYVVSGGELAENAILTYTVEDGENGLLALGGATKFGHKLKSWYYDQELTKACEQNKYLSVEQAKDLTLYACWELVNYNVSYQTFGGVADGQVLTYNIQSGENGLLAIDGVATRNGYIFDGWYSDADFVQDTQGVIDVLQAKDLVLYAKWDLISYSITYRGLKDGIQLPGDSYTYAYNTEQCVELPRLQKENFAFLGWCEDENLTDEFSCIPQGSFGDKVLYAKYERLYGAQGGANLVDVNSYFAYPALYGKLDSQNIVISLKDFLGSSELNGTIVDSLANSLQSGSNNFGLLSQIPNGFAVCDTAHFGGDDLAFKGAISVVVPQAINQLVEQGYVGRLTLVFKVKGQQNVNQSLSVLIQSSNEKVDFVQELQGLSYSDVGYIGEQEQTVSVSVSNIASAKYFVLGWMVNVQGANWNQENHIDFQVYDIELNVELKKVPTFSVYYQLPQTVIDNGQFNVYACDSNSGLALKQQENLKQYYLSFNSRQNTSVDSFDDDSSLGVVNLTYEDVNNGYTNKAWSVVTDIDLQNPKALSESVVKVDIYRLVELGANNIFVCSMVPNIRTIILKVDSVDGQIDFIPNGWEYSANGKYLYKTVCNGMTVRLPSAQDIFANNATFLHWEAIYGISGQYQENEVITSDLLMSDVSLCAKFASIFCLNDYETKSTTNSGVMLLSTASTLELHYSNLYYGQENAKWSRFNLAETANSFGYVDALIEFMPLSGFDVGGNLSNTTSDYKLNGVYILYISGPLSGKIVQANKVDDYKYSIQNVCGKYYVYGEWTVVERPTYTIRFYDVSNTLVYQMPYTQGQSIPQSLFPDGIKYTRVNSVFAGWYTFDGVLKMEINPGDSGDINLRVKEAPYNLGQVSYGHQQTISSGKYEINQSFDLSRFVASQMLLDNGYRYIVTANIQPTQLEIKLKSKSPNRASTYEGVISNLQIQFNGNSYGLYSNLYYSIPPKWFDSQAYYMRRETSTMQYSFECTNSRITMNRIWYSSLTVGSGNDNSYCDVGATNVILTLKAIRCYNEVYSDGLTYHQNVEGEKTKRIINISSSSIKLSGALFQGWERPGYEFMGWAKSPNGTPLNLNGTYSSSIGHVYAIWNKIGNQVDYYDVYTDGEHCSVNLASVEYVDNGQDISSFAQTTVASGFSFEQVYVDEDCTIAATLPITNISTNLSLYKKYSITPPIISAKPIAQVLYGESIDLNDYINVTTYGNQFSYTVSWLRNDEPIDFGTNGAIISNVNEGNYCENGYNYVNVYRPVVTLTVKVGGVELVYNRISTITLQPVIVPITVEAYLKYSSKEYDGTNIELSDNVIAFVALNGGNTFVAEYANGSVNINYNIEYIPALSEYEFADSISYFAKDAGAYVIKDLALSSDNFMWNCRFVDDNSEEYPALSSKQLKFVVNKKIATIYIWSVDKKYGGQEDADKIVSDIIPSEITNIENRVVSSQGILDCDKQGNSLLVGLSRESGEDAGNYYVVYDLSKLSAYQRNNYQFDVVGWIQSNATLRKPNKVDYSENAQKYYFDLCDVVVSNQDLLYIECNGLAWYLNGVANASGNFEIGLDLNNSFDLPADIDRWGGLTIGLQVYNNRQRNFVIAVIKEATVQEEVIVVNVEILPPMFNIEG